MRSMVPSVLLLALTGCASIQPVADSYALTVAPFRTKLLFATVGLPAETPLVGSLVDGKPAFCSTVNGYFVNGDARGICLFDTKGSGYFDKYYILGTIAADVYDGIHVPYTLIGSPQMKVHMLGLTVEAAQMQKLRNYCAYQGNVASAMRPGGILDQAVAGVQVSHACMSYYSEP